MHKKDFICARVKSLSLQFSVPQQNVLIGAVIFDRCTLEYFNFLGILEKRVVK